MTFRIDLLKKQPKTISQQPPFTLNNARLQLECLCRLTPAGKGPAVGYVLSSSCKAEQVNVKEDMWHLPGADMCIVASAEEFLVIKSWDRNNRGRDAKPAFPGTSTRAADRQERRQLRQARRIDARQTQGKLLESTQEIVQAGLGKSANRCETEYPAPDGTLVWLEYPIKIINVSEREVFYQVDTGPLLIPDAGSFDGTHPISVLRQAFIAHNQLGTDGIPRQCRHTHRRGHQRQPLLEGGEGEGG